MTTNTTIKYAPNSAQARAAEAFSKLSSELGFTNKMEAPRLVKVVLTSGVGSGKDKTRHALVVDRMTKIAGQKPANRGAKKSIATFKIRQGDIVGYQVTLRGSRMYDFLDKLIHIAFPRTRDFQGITTSSVDEMGNLSFGLREHTIFPETSDEDIRDVFGIGVTIVTTAKNKKDAVVYLRHLGIPFKK